jgi:hypothetical protein
MTTPTTKHNTERVRSGSLRVGPFPLVWLSLPAEKSSGTETHKRRSKDKLAEGRMCPACIANAAVVIVGAGSTGGILAVCIGKFKTFFTANRLSRFQQSSASETKEKEHGHK